MRALKTGGYGAALKKRVRRDWERQGSQRHQPSSFYARGAQKEGTGGVGVTLNKRNSNPSATPRSNSVNGKKAQEPE